MSVSPSNGQKRASPENICSQAGQRLALGVFLVPLPRGLGEGGGGARFAAATWVTASSPSPRVEASPGGVALIPRVIGMVDGTGRVYPNSRRPRSQEAPSTRGSTQPSFHGGGVANAREPARRSAHESGFEEASR